MFVLVLIVGPGVVLAVFKGLAYAIGGEGSIFIAVAVAACTAFIEDDWPTTTSSGVATIFA